MAASTCAREYETQNDLPSLSSIIEALEASEPSATRSSPQIRFAGHPTNPYGEDKTEIMSPPASFLEATRPGTPVAKRPAVMLRYDAPPAPRATLSAVHTRLLTLSPAFLAALKGIAPKRRRSKVPYVVGLAFAAVVAVLGADASTRDFAVAQSHHVAALF